MHSAGRRIFRRFDSTAEARTVISSRVSSRIWSISDRSIRPCLRPLCQCKESSLSVSVAVRLATMSINSGSVAANKSAIIHHAACRATNRTANTAQTTTNTTIALRLRPGCWWCNTTLFSGGAGLVDAVTVFVTTTYVRPFRPCRGLDLGCSQYVQVPLWHGLGARHHSGAMFETPRPCARPFAGSSHPV